ncbi:MAG: hypothetical protein KC591_04540 [Gemmatimonadetes bacterium]|nr:hypothetical protein [Gemmatimonadota bacterium]
MHRTLLLLAASLAVVPAASAADPVADRPATKAAHPPGIVVVDFTADPITDLAQTVFWVRLSEPRPEVSIEIRPVGGDPVAVVALPLEAGAGFVVWDGIVTNGAEAPAGAYVARVFGEGVDARVEFVR